MAFLERLNDWATVLFEFTRREQMRYLDVCVVPAGDASWKGENVEGLPEYLYLFCK